MDILGRGQALHDKATRGEKLTTDEQYELEQWYAQEDRTEGSILHTSAIDEADTSLQRQVHATLDRLRVVTRQVQELSIENDMVRREIAELRHRLSQRPTTRAA